MARQVSSSWLMMPCILSLWPTIMAIPSLSSVWGVRTCRWRDTRCQWGRTIYFKGYRTLIIKWNYLTFFVSLGLFKEHLKVFTFILSTAFVKEKDLYSNSSCSICFKPCLYCKHLVPPRNVGSASILCSAKHRILYKQKIYSYTIHWISTTTYTYFETRPTRWIIKSIWKLDSSAYH